MAQQIDSSAMVVESCPFRDMLTVTMQVVLTSVDPLEDLSRQQSYESLTASCKCEHGLSMQALTGFRGQEAT